MVRPCPHPHPPRDDDDTPFPFLPRVLTHFVTTTTTHLRPLRLPCLRPPRNNNNNNTPLSSPSPSSPFAYKRERTIIPCRTLSSFPKEDRLPSASSSRRHALSPPLRSASFTRHRPHPRPRPYAVTCCLIHALPSPSPSSLRRHAPSCHHHRPRPYIVMRPRPSSLRAQVQGRGFKARLRLRLPPHLGLYPHPLAYVHFFKPLRAFDENIKMFYFGRSTRNHIPNAAVVPIANLVHPCHLIPRFPSGALNPRWCRGDSMNAADTFFLNRYINMRTFEQYGVHSVE
jgi:hypothetical protein